MKTLSCQGRSLVCGSDKGFRLCLTTKARCPLVKDVERQALLGKGELLMQWVVRTRKASLFWLMKQVLVQEIECGLFSICFFKRFVYCLTETVCC